ncbi:MAG: phosphonate metabolism protein/1,5-bisphosphokinase (PRPP-forming) PhnN [Rhodobacteraceae bacterium CG17_big_fil_post_rev_8_21_14_2_50_65_11]|nr:MAG: phosphonate metabolism protein/1,5-bisphosphokinase (PRPP-forming) PhnN [Rhodobacteraceae bacterium CG17_big_fil_post_rev_8_21_14_2_50_65_11]
MRQGRFIAVVGPSGVGKDSLIEALIAAEPDFHRVRRVITRPRDAGGEDFEGVSREVFEARRDNGDFALWWEAHGLLYGIPASVHRMLSLGVDTLANLSRAHLEQAAAVFPAFHVLHVTAATEVLAARLAARERETVDQVRARLARQVPLPEGLPVTHVDNGGWLSDCVDQALGALYPEKA